MPPVPFTIIIRHGLRVHGRRRCPPGRSRPDRTRQPGPDRPATQPRAARVARVNHRAAHGGSARVSRSRTEVSSTVTRSSAVCARPSGVSRVFRSGIIRNGAAAVWHPPRRAHELASDPSQLIQLRLERGNRGVTSSTRWPSLVRPASCRASHDRARPGRAPARRAGP